MSTDPAGSTSPATGPGGPAAGPAGYGAGPAGLATVRPRYGAASLADVLPGVLAALGVPASAGSSGSADPLGLADGPLAGARAVAVLLVDGLGQHLLPLAAPYAPTLAGLADGHAGGASARVLTTGFPSTTPTSLVSLGTGAAPGEHGLVGFTVNVPGTDRVLNHIEWSDDPDPYRWQPLPTQFARAEAAGVAAYVVSRPEFAGSGLTVAANRGGRFHGAAGVGALAGTMVTLLRSAQVPAIVYGYHPTLDHAGHLFGLDSPEWRSAVAEVDRLVTRLIEGLPPDTALVVTADHGQLNVPAGHRFDIDADPRLIAGVRVVAGEPRMRHLHTVSGATTDVIATWRGVLGPAAWVVSREEAVAAGWFGPILEDHLARIGDVVVACHGDFAVLATAHEPATTARLVAFHGSATEAEMLIPLLTIRR